MFFLSKNDIQNIDEVRAELEDLTTTQFEAMDIDFRVIPAARFDKNIMEGFELGTSMVVVDLIKCKNGAFDGFSDSELLELCDVQKYLSRFNNADISQLKENIHAAEYNPLVSGFPLDVSGNEVLTWLRTAPGKTIDTPPYEIVRRANENSYAALICYDESHDTFSRARLGKQKGKGEWRTVYLSDMDFAARIAGSILEYKTKDSKTNQNTYNYYRREFQICDWSHICTTHKAIELCDLTRIAKHESKIAVDADAVPVNNNNIFIENHYTSTPGSVSDIRESFIGINVLNIYDATHGIEMEECQLGDVSDGTFVEIHLTKLVKGHEKEGFIMSQKTDNSWVRWNPNIEYRHYTTIGIKNAMQASVTGSQPKLEKEPKPKAKKETKTKPNTKSISVWDRSKIMKRAAKLAKEAVERHGGKYKDYIGNAIRQSWSIEKDAYIKEHGALPISSKPRNKYKPYNKSELCKQAWSEAKRLAAENTSDSSDKINARLFIKQGFEIALKPYLIKEN